MGGFARAFRRGARSRPGFSQSKTPGEPVGSAKRVSGNPLDAAFIKPEHAVIPALSLEVSLEIIPRPKILAAVVAKDLGFRASVARDSQPDRQAVGALQLVVQIFSFFHGALAGAPKVGPVDNAQCLAVPEDTAVDLRAP